MELDTKTGESDRAPVRPYLTAELAPNMTSDKTSFAYVSARDRWPSILSGIIDDVERTATALNEKKLEVEGWIIVGELTKLKHEIEHNQRLPYNEELTQLGPRTWFDIPWLYAECYFYRRINTSFSLSKHWRTYDCFSRQKLAAFKSSRSAVLELAARYRDLITQFEGDQQEISAKSPHVAEAVEKLVFEEMSEVCLWGNATDLSLLTQLSYEDIQRLQGSEARKCSKQNIIVNDLPAVFTALKSASWQAPGKERRVDIVLDNAGFELFVDFILAGYLLASNLATKVVFHPKSIPWFVSDVIPQDLEDLLDVLANPRPFYREHGLQDSQLLSESEVEDLSFLSQQWSQHLKEGRFVVQTNRYWTGPGSYWRLPKVDPELLTGLQGSELVIFKGDLNYRKLTGDAMWDPTTPFGEGIGPLGRSSGVRTLALRTCKADTVVGLPKGEDERLRATEDGGGASEARQWAWSGRWAVIQYWDGKS